MRSHYSSELSEKHIGESVEVYGWVHRRRDHGGVIFIDLRDREGLIQTVFEPEQKEIFAQAEGLRSEFVLHVKGKVRARPEGMQNANLPTGKIEVCVDEFEIINKSKTPPFQVEDEFHSVGEDIRLRYRYLDLRRPEMTQRLVLRSKVMQAMRSYLSDNGFLDIETPMLTKATPEGARDYLVPSRVHQGSFYALPQSPQLFKQLLMVSGFERYYQIVRCFRDEDLRADRQPEFTQLDIETSFLNEKEIQDIMENMLKKLFSEILNIELPDFPRITYEEAMRRYGSDKPDLRIPLELVDIADIVKDVEFKVFSGPAKKKDGRVVALCLPNGGELTRKQLDDYTKFVAIYGAKGLAYIKINDLDKGVEGLQSPILKFLPEDVIQEILKRVNAKNGDVVFFGCDKAKVVNEAMGALRVKLGEDCNLREEGWKPLWVVDFPMFELEGDKVQALHHPFTAPQAETAKDLLDCKGECLSRAYDVVLNGFEIGGGSIRINDMEMQSAVFKLLGIDEQEAQSKFGFLLEALQYGAPIHGGIAFGIDRVVMLMAGVDSIREVMAFPKTQTAQCLMTQAPAEISPQQMREVGIKLRETEATA